LGVAPAGIIRCFIRKFDPDSRVIARPFAGPHITVDAGGDQAARKGWAQQQMIDAQSGVAGKRVPEILPERVDPLIGVERAQRVCPALLDQAAIGVAHLRPVIAYFAAAPEGEEVLADYTKLLAWWQVIRERKSVLETDPGLPDMRSRLS
jgi:hypothetical protein